ncbi:MAG: hypothetical protein HC765_12740 [Brachymonas sp.]|nr:hypothetical protein [Brachymonas sp.]
MPFLIRARLLCFTLIAHPAAFAHGDANTQPWVDGALHVLMSPMCCALLLGFALATMQLEEQQQFRVNAAAAVSALVTLFVSNWAEMSLTTPFVRAACAACLTALGMRAVFGKTLGYAMSLLLGLLIGIVAVCASEPDNLPWVGMFSRVGAIFTVACFFSASLRESKRIAWLGRHLPLGARIIGSWLACFGLLMLAFSLKT